MMGSCAGGAAAGELSRQPARSFSQRIQNVIFKFFPVDLY